LIKNAHLALSYINKLRVEQPTLNKYELADASELEAQGLANALDINNYGPNSTLLQRRDNSTDAENAKPSPYSIPPELAEAARIVAEASAQLPTGNHSDVAAAIVAKYQHHSNDTNKPDPLQVPGGLLGTFGENGADSGDGLIQKRAS